MAPPFDFKPIPELKMWDKMRNPFPKAHAILELNNLLATPVRVNEITLDQIIALCAKYKVDFSRDFPEELEQFYYDFILYCLVDSEFQDYELVDITHLKLLFSLTDEQHDRVYHDVVNQVYARNVKEIFADNQITEEHKAKLKSLQSHLQVAEPSAKQIYTLHAQAVMQQKFEEVVADNQLAPEEEEELKSLARSLGARLNVNQSDLKELERMRLFWAIENKPLPVIPPPPGFKAIPEEEIYFQAPTEYIQLRKMAPDSGNAHSSVRMKVVKSVHFRSGGTMTFSPIKEDIAKREQGTLFITNKRLLFLSKDAFIPIGHEEMIDFDCYTNGIEIGQEYQPSVIFQLKKDVDLACAILGRALRRW